MEWIEKFVSEGGVEFSEKTLVILSQLWVRLGAHEKEMGMFKKESMPKKYERR